MLRNEIICEIIIKWGLAKTYPQALSMFVQAFVENFRNKSLDHWDTKVPKELAEKFINGVDTRERRSIESLIVELDAFLKNTKLSAVLLMALKLFIQRMPFMLLTLWAWKSGMR